jgi:poly(3-hydroxybutyrate) depolymerase
MKTSELTGAALDWAVHVALHGSCEGYAEHEYSTDWSQGGPIIEREGISVLYRVGVNMTASINGQYTQTIGHRHKGNIGLLVAMRCYVASKLGDDIEIPKELT